MLCILIFMYIHGYMYIHACMYAHIYVYTQIFVYYIYIYIWGERGHALIMTFSQVSGVLFIIGEPAFGTYL